MKINFCILAILVTLISCSDNEQNPDYIIRNADGVVVDMEQHLWMYDISGERYAYGNLIPQLYDDIVILAGSHNKKSSYIMGVDIFTGKKQYKWDKIYEPLSMDFYDVDSNQFEENVLLADYDNIFAYNIPKGEMRWRIIDDQLTHADNIMIYGDKYYFSGKYQNEEGIAELSVFEGNLSTGSFNKIASPAMMQTQLFSGSYGSISGIAMHEKNGNPFAFFTVLEHYDVYTSRNLGYVSLFDINAKEFVYEMVPVGDTLDINFGIRPVLFDDVGVVNGGSEIFGVDIKSGKTLWKRDEFQKNGSGTFIMDQYQGQLIAINKGGFVSRILSIDPQTGQNNWEILGEGGHVENFQILDNMLFFVSRGTGELYVYDLDTQKMLVRMKTPDIDKFNGYGGMQAFMVDDKLMLVVCSYLNAYCYDLSFLIN